MASGWTGSGTNHGALVMPIGSVHFALAVNGRSLTARCPVSREEPHIRAAVAMMIGRVGTRSLDTSSMASRIRTSATELELRFNKTEFLVRYSGVNQRAILANDISTIPVFGFNGSPSVFSPHAREVALALDYWIAPSIVWMTEVDFELPRAGGTLYNFPGSASVPVASGIGATPNDVAVMTQLAIGF